MRSERSIGSHFAFMAGMAALHALCVVYPFLPGDYDRLAVPLSTMAQVAGVVGLPLVFLGLLWIVKPRRGFALAVTSVTVGTFDALIVAVFAALSVGYAFGVLVLAVWMYIVARLIPLLKAFKNAKGGALNPTPLYLVVLPVFAVVVQLALASPLTQRSRDTAIANAKEFIRDIEDYRVQQGRYPVSLQAQNVDYLPHVVGVERYFYASQGDAYNLSFEQPRFLLDRIGTREWVVYNPRDEHRASSHVAWLLRSPEHLAASAGWHASGDTGHPHWRSFFFD